MANLILRGGGAVLAVLLIATMPDLLKQLGATPARQSINLHLAFNLLLALAALPFVRPITAALSYLMAEKPTSNGALKVASALDPALLDRPQRAIDCAARELLGMGQKIEQMLIAVEPLYDQWDGATASMIADQDKAVKNTHSGYQTLSCTPWAEGHGRGSEPSVTGACVDFIQPRFRIRCHCTDHAGPRQASGYAEASILATGPR